MLNLFYSESYWGHTDKMNGPKKVIHNLLESLKQEGIDFAVNEEKYNHNFVLQYDAKGHEKHSKIEQETCVIGPQVWLFDPYGQFLLKNPNYYKTIIAPSQWVKDLYVNKFGMDESKVVVWSVGIIPFEAKKEPEFDCLVYFKRRTTEEFTQVTEFLKSKGITYKTLSYGGYNDKDVETLSNKCKFCFMVNGTESQGIAVQEIMSTDTPMFVWDIKEWNDQGDEWRVPATSIPYWSDECGEVFYNVEDMEKTYDRFYAKIDTYQPRKYVEENLSLKKSVNTLLEILNAA